jgi:hypothetical protein
MILETVTILYYTLATVSIGLVLYKNYNNQIHQCINKHFYKYTQVPNEESDLDLQTNLDNDETYILFSDENINNENNQNIFEMNTFNNNNNSDNINNINNINLQKKNIIIDFK